MPPRHARTTIASSLRVANGGVGFGFAILSSFAFVRGFICFSASVLLYIYTCSSIFSLVITSYAIRLLGSWIDRMP